MFRTISRAMRYTVCTAVVLTGFGVGIAAAQTAGVADLGKAWPNAKDLSSSPNWHAYVFEQDGVRYIQVNDRNGTVHAAIGVVGNTAFALPMGVDAQHVSTALSSDVSVPSEVVYQDDTATVAAMPQDDGTVQIIVRAACDNPAACGQNHAM